MFIMAKRNIRLPSADGSLSHKVQRDFVGNIPDWATKTRYFKRLVSDGIIVVPESKKDKNLQDADEKPVEIRRGKKKEARKEPEEAAEAEESAETAPEIEE